MQKIHIEESIRIIQSDFGVQLLVFRRLDIPCDHQIIEPNNKSMLSLKRSLSISTEEDVSHIGILSLSLENIPKQILEHLLKDNESKRDSMQNLTQKQTFEDRGFNSGVSCSKGENKNKRDKIPCGITIPDSNVHEGENLFIDKIFKELSKYLK